MSVNVYEVIVSDEDKVDLISLVDDPAIESNFIAMSTEKTMLKLLSEEKRLVSGPVLIPEQKILRNLKGEAAFIKFSKDTIEKLSFATMKDISNKIAMTNINHDSNKTIDMKKAYVVESWLSKESGEYPSGTWFITMKIEDEDTWAMVKSGDLVGFSIEANLGLSPVELKSIVIEKEIEPVITKTPVTRNVVEDWDIFMKDLESFLA